MLASTRVFVSATSADLGTVRKIAKEALLAMDCHPVEQTSFPPDYRTVEGMLRNKIGGCQAVVHIVGMRYGAEPDPAQLPDSAVRRSYTQLEYDIARQLSKKLYVFLCPEEFPYDSCDAEPDDKIQLQRQHRGAIMADPRLRTKISTQEEIGLRVREIQVELDALRTTVRRGTKSLVIGGIILILLLGGIGFGIARLTGLVGGVGKSIQETSQKTIEEIQKLYADPEVLVVKLKNHILTLVDDQIAPLRADSSNRRRIDEIEKQRDQQLANVDELVTTIRDGLAGDANPIFVEAARILAEQGVDEAIAYLQAKQPAIESRVTRTKARRQQAEEEFRQSLEPWLLQAELHKTNLAWSDALRLFKRVAEEAPQWSRARRELGGVLMELAKYDDAESHLKAALDLAEDDRQRAVAANDLGILYLDVARFNEAEPLMRRALAVDEQTCGALHPDVARDLTNLARLLLATNRLEEAEPLMRRALAIVEQSFGAEHPDVAIRLNNLATLLATTNRLAEAEPLVRRALAIDEQTYGALHPKVAPYLNNLAQLLANTNRLAEAEPLMRRALAIDEQSFGTDHPRVASNLNNLASLLYNLNRLVEAEPLMRRAMAVSLQSLGAEHPEVARKLNNLAQVLTATNRLAEAEPLMRRALAIDEQSYGAEHTNVARDLNNLAQLLQDTNRLAEAEPLMRRVVDIFEKSLGADHPNVALCLNNLAQLLQDTNRLAEAEPLMRRAVAINEQSFGAEHPTVAIDLNNLARLLQDTNRLAEAKPLMQRSVEIVVLFEKSTGHEHSHMQLALKNFRGLLEEMKLSTEQIDERVEEAMRSVGPLEAIEPEIERLLGPAKPSADVLAALDLQYKADGKPEVYFLPLHQPIALHLDQLLGPTKSTEEVLASLDARHREQGKPAVWFLPLDEPIVPHLDELLGPSKFDIPADEPISLHLDKLFGPIEEATRQ